MSKLFDLVSSVLDGILGGGDDKPAPAPAAAPAPVPVVTPVVAMPAPGPKDPNATAAKRKSIAEQLRRRGRASTIMTNLSDDTLG